jgi:hypothetical protein
MKDQENRKKLELSEIYLLLDNADNINLGYCYFGFNII